MSHSAFDPRKHPLYLIGYSEGERDFFRPEERLQRDFPKLVPGSHKIIGAATCTYNCIAWAVGEKGRFWSPGQGPNYYWPPGFPPEFTIAVLVQIFRIFRIPNLRRWPI